MSLQFKRSGRNRHGCELTCDYDIAVLPASFTTLRLVCTSRAGFTSSLPIFIPDACVHFSYLGRITKALLQKEK